MLKSLKRGDQIQKNRVQSTKNTKRGKTSFLKEYVENQDLYRPIQNKTMTTQE